MANVASKASALVPKALTSEAAFDELHKLASRRIGDLRADADELVHKVSRRQKAVIQNDYVAALNARLALAKETKETAFKETDAAKKREGLKKAGDTYVGVLYGTQLFLLKLKIALLVDWAAQLPRPPAIGTLSYPLDAYGNDKAILALLQAALDGDAAQMTAALPAAQKRVEHHLTFTEAWITALGESDVLTQRALKIADIVMLAISIYQVKKMPVVPGGSPTPPPAILSLLPGGALAASRVSPASLASAVEAMGKLVAIGALDGVLVAGIGKLGGGPSLSLPELQRPTSLAVQQSKPPGGSSTTKATSGASSPSGASQAATAQGGNNRLLPGLKIDSIQFGKKVAKHAQDFGLNPANPAHRQWVRERIETIVQRYDEIRQGPWNPRGGGGNDFLFFRQGADVVVTKPNGDFVTILSGGQSNGWFSNASHL